MSDRALMSQRFRGFLPVVVDVETGGFHEITDALLQIAAEGRQFQERRAGVQQEAEPFPRRYQPAPSALSA